MSRTIILILIIFIPTLIQAQRLATGEVFASDSKEPLPLATVILITPGDSSIWAGTTTDENGAFAIPLPPDRTVSLVVRMLGYATSLPIHIQAGNENVSLPRVTLTEDAMMLEGVTVRAEKPLFELLPGKLVVNVEKSPTFSGKSALFILQQTPGMIVSPNGAITANGKNGVSVMLNGRVVKLSPEMVGSFLEGISASTIKKIEFINNPDASVDAEGEAGIINVITSDAVVRGFNGGAFVSGGYSWYPKFGVGGNGTYVNDRIQIAAQYSYNHNRTRTYWDNFVDFTDDGDQISIASYNVREEENADQSLTLQADYRITPKTTFGANFITNIRDHGYASGLPSTATTTFKRNSVIESISSSTYAARHKRNRYMGNVNIRHQLNQKASISADFDYLNSFNNIPVLYSAQNENTPQLYEPTMRSKKETPIHTYAIKIDHTYVFSESVSITAGAKYTTNTFLNTFQVDSLQNDIWVRDETNSSRYRYGESVPAAYLAAKMKLSKNDDLSAGLRYESTNMEIAGSDGVTKRRFNNLFPHLSFTRTLSPGNSFTATVSRRINRPSYWDLAPFAIFLGPNVFVAGNETLRPSLSNSATVTYSAKAFSLTVNANLNQHTISNYQVRLIRDRDMIAANAQNLKHSKSLHLTVALPTRQIFRIWETTHSMSVFTESIVADYIYLSETATHNQKGFRLSTNNTVNLPNAWKFEFNGNYTSATLAGTSKHLGFGTITAGLGKQLKGAMVNLNVSDMLWSWRWNRVTEAKDFRSEMKYQGEPRIVTLTIRKNIGNQRVTSMKKRNTASEDELNRM